MDVPDAAPQAHPLLIVALSGRNGSEALLRRACREASKMPGAEVMAVHVPQRGVGSTPAALQPELARLRALADEVGATWHMVLGQGLGEALLSFARRIQATHLIVGVPLPDGTRKNRAESVCV